MNKKILALCIILLFTFSIVAGSFAAVRKTKVAKKNRKIVAQAAKKVAPSKAPNTKFKKVVIGEERIEVKPIKITALPSAIIPKLMLVGITGQVIESASGTNNTSNMGGMIVYENDLGTPLSYRASVGIRNYDMIYLVTRGGAATAVAVVENRYDINADLNYQMMSLGPIDFSSAEFRALLGLRYVNLDNAIAPANYTGIALGADYNFKLNVLGGLNAVTELCYVMPIVKTGSNASVIGVPNSALQYKFGIDLPIDKKLGLAFSYLGESMSLGVAGNSRQSNLITGAFTYNL